MFHRTATCVGLISMTFSAGCLHVKLEPIQVHAVVDVNVKVDRALTDFFGDLDRKSSVINSSSSPSPNSS